MTNTLSLATKKAILFDVDGTLVDSVHGLVLGLHDTFVHYGNLDYPYKRIKPLLGTPLRSQMQLALGEGASEEELAEAMAYALTRYKVHEHHSVEFGPAIDAMKIAHASGLKIALVTSKNAEEIVSFKQRFHHLEAVDTIVCSSDVRHPKPAADSAILACERLGVAIQDAVMIGDSVYDLQCAKSAGMACVAVTYGAMPKCELVAENPDLIFDSPENLLDWFNQTLLNNHEKENNQLVERTG